MVKTTQKSSPNQSSSRRDLRSVPERKMMCLLKRRSRRN